MNAATLKAAANTYRSGDFPAKTNFPAKNKPATATVRPVDIGRLVLWRSDSLTRAGAINPRPPSTLHQPAERWNPRPAQPH